LCAVGTRERIPGHLRCFVVEQDWGAYDEIDHAVWRFILLQAHARLCATAHPAYARGLEQTGISIERIPRIAEMDQRLASLGWGAVAVDGFIPPRAFQEFQAEGILPIATAIRRPEHLAYTPAPDIVHESAGHAPILPDPAYRAFLQRFGVIGARAFSSQGDRRLYPTVHRLSELREDPASSTEAIADAERELAQAQAELGPPSEAALCARLHWWTVEYGLVGTPRDYRIYGAGLLSSLGESHFCHDPSVRKLPLDASCVEFDYDITKPQPQLFVAEDFEHLQAVLEEFASTLAQHRGGARGLERMLASAELGTLRLDSGLEVSGVLERVQGSLAVPVWLELRGPCALAHSGRMLEGHGPDAHPDGMLVLLGPLAGGADPARLDPRSLEGDLDLRFGLGVRVSGRALGLRRDEGGRPLLLELDACRVTQRGRPIAREGRFALTLGSRVVATHAGPADAAFRPESSFPETRVPRRRARADGRLLALYRRALGLWESPGSPELVAGFREIADALERSFPEDWLLAWNLLECLGKVDRGAELAALLRERLLAIERRHPRDAPISTGLRYLADRYGA
jgi:phenylalanine-4-hydroxylase